MFGIPLTEEWLLKFGFTIHPNSKSMWYPASPHKTAYVKMVDNYEFTVCFNSQKNCVEIPLILVKSKKEVEFYFVHEFQNFFFSCNKLELVYQP